MSSTKPLPLGSQPNLWRVSSLETGLLAVECLRAPPGVLVAGSHSGADWSATEHYVAMLAWLQSGSANVHRQPEN